MLRRLRLAAPAVHWRNTWLLAAGRVFSTLEHLRAPVIGLLREIDAESALSNVLPPGPALALELLDDDVAARAPHFRRQLLTHALEQLRDPPADNPFAPARVLLDLSATPDLRALINRAVDQSMAATVEERATIWFLLREWGSETGELAARARQLRHTFTPEERGSLTAWEAVQRPNAPALPDGARRHRLGPQLRDNLQAAGLSGSGQELAQKLVTELDRIVVFSLPPDHRTYLPPPVVTSVPSAAEAVAHPDVAEALALAVLEIPTERWAVSMEIRSILRAALTRQPIGSQLVELTSAAAGE